MPTNKEKHYTKQRAFGPSTEMNKGKKTSGELMRDQNSDRKLVMLLFEDSGAEGEEIID